MNDWDKVKCPAPWGELYIDPDGSVRTCCIAPVDKPLGNINESSLEEIWNNEQSTHIRKKILEGKKVKNCIHCYKNEESGHPSLRTQMLDNYGNIFEDMWKRADPAGYDDMSNIVYLDIRWSNLCNFACRMCSPVLSSRRSELQIGKDSKFNHLSEINFTPDDVPIEQIKDVYLAGGEPFLMEETYRLLDRLKENGRTDVTITITTNLSVLYYKKRDIIEELKPFFRVILLCSLDGYGSAAEYVRQGTKWNQIEKNLETIWEKTKKSYNITAVPVYTLSALNAYRLPDFFRYIQKFKLFERNSKGLESSLVSPVFSPEVLDAKHLPEDFRQEIAQRYRQFLTEFNYESALTQNVKGELDRLENVEPGESSDRYKRALLFRIREEDRMFGTNYKDVVPELEVLEKYENKNNS